LLVALAFQPGLSRAGSNCAMLPLASARLHRI
jgi:hypothetical protein